MKDIKKMESELKTVQKRIVEIQPEKKKLEERLEAAKKNHSRIESRITELRNERQDILVAEGDLEDVNTRLKEIRKSGEILEDEIEGLSRRLASLEVEETRLAAQSKELGKEIFKEKTIRPLVIEYNRIAPELAETLKGFQAAMETYIRTFDSPGHRILLDQQANTGPRSLPGIWLPGEEPVPEYYNAAVESEKLAAQERERHVRNQYPDCRCFRCTSYAGVLPDLTIRCGLLGSEVPREVLSGKTPARDSEAARQFFLRCSFTPVS